MQAGEQLGIDGAAGEHGHQVLLNSLFEGKPGMSAAKIEITAVAACRATAPAKSRSWRDPCALLGTAIALQQLNWRRDQLRFGAGGVAGGGVPDAESPPSSLPPAEIALPGNSMTQLTVFPVALAAVPAKPEIVEKTLPAKLRRSGSAAPAAPAAGSPPA
jgi:hypothetical protein